MEKVYSLQYILHLLSNEDSVNPTATVIAVYDNYDEAYAAYLKKEKLQSVGVDGPFPAGRFNVGDTITEDDLDEAAIN